MNRINTLLFAALLLSGCGTYYPGEPGGARPHFTAALNGANEVPANATTGKGDATVTLDKATKTLSWNVTYSGLTGNATAAHFHPAAPGANASPVVPIATGSVPNPAVGTAVLTDAQIADLTAGKWYINIHTQANPGGEIRGQVVAK